MNRPTCVLIGAASRTGEQAAPQVRQLLSEAGVDPACVTLCRHKGDAQRAIANLKPESIVWVGGGDGSVRDASVSLVEGKHTLGVLPLGTGNALARELGVPLKTEQAVPWLLESATARPIDHGLADGRPFVNMISAGVSVNIADRISRMSKGKWGVLVYLPALWAAIQVIRPFRLTLEAPESRFEGDAIQMVIASTRNHGGLFRVTENAAIDDGLLSMYVVGEGNRGDMLRFGLALLRGRQGELPQVWECNAVRASLRFGRDKTLVADGDKIGRKRIWEVEIRHHALTVLGAEPGS